ncbi:RIMS-binding protein 2 [Aplysia californica]|uniref:RIMS-binding protein 2 n=1 Tax=Aplysia californica TaxID=6500 RepID=A0ABM1A4S6_APLCA|nr:RIMS-binding protein 2 [Aplysia californica]
MAGTRWHGEKLNCVCGRGRLDLMKTKKEDREREKTLQKKLGDLTSQIQRLERRIALLRTENDTLRQKQDEQRPLEEKIKSLKKRNAELASIARRLEEKAKTLQQENSKARSKSSGMTTGGEEGAEVEHLKRVFSRQRAKDLAEHAKSMLAKDKEIEELRKKCQELADQLSNGDLLLPQNAPQFEEKEELVNIIKQAAKERLQLEQQLAHSKSKEKGSASEEASGGASSAVKKEAADQAASDQQYRGELEAANKILHGEIEKLEQALQKAGSLEQQLSDKASECSTLTSDLTQIREENQTLEQQIDTGDRRNRELEAQVQGLSEKVKGVEKITEECNTLKTSLATAQKEREAAQEEVKHLNVRVHSLENLVRDLQDSAEQASSLENAHQLALSQLREKQAQIEQLQQIKSSEEDEQLSAVSALNSKLKELEDKREKEERKREELSKEVERLQREAAERQKAFEEAEREKKELLLQSKQRAAEQVTEATVAPAQSAAPVLAKPQSPAGGEEEERETTKGGESRRGMEKTGPLNQNDRPMAESFLSAWAQKGPIQVYIAKYNYDPFEFSPNENPEAELPLTAGDYVLVVGEMDEDGFFDGELIDGRQGLVPSNFIEKVEDEDLAEFHAALMQAGHGDYHNLSNNNNTSASSITSATTTTTAAAAAASSANFSSLNNNNHLSNKDSDPSHHKLDYENRAGTFEESNSDLEDIAEIDEDTVSVNSRVLANGASSNNFLPCPRSLSLDRQLSNSLLISWKGPDPASGLEVQSYHVLVDGQFRTSIKGSERTKALLEGVDAGDVHRVCVRCLSNRGQSKDAQCTMVVGKDVYPTPSELKVGHVSPTSASLSWLPGNSNYQHSIVVNGKEVRVVKPGVFRHTLTGLSPGVLHKVTLIAKSISGVLNEEKSRKWVENVSASVEFTTPEAADHVVLGSEDFQGQIPTHLSVRTTSASGVESSDSDVIRLPPVVVKEMADGAAAAPGAAQEEMAKSADVGKVRSPSTEEPKGHDTDEEIEAAFREAHSSSPGVNAHISSAFSDSSSSELSDIPEVEEDLIGSHDSHLNEVGAPLTNQMPSPSQQGEKTSPKPAPRQRVPAGSAGVDSGPKEFHAKKPAASDQGNNLLAAPTRVVPAIEITRDSSSERGPSFDEDTDRENSSSSNQTAPGSGSGSGSTAMGAKGRAPDAAISSHYRGDAENPSAFRQVEQSKNRESGGAGAGEADPDVVTSSSSPSSRDKKSSAASTTRDDAHSPSSRSQPTPKGHQTASPRSGAARQQQQQSPEPHPRKHITSASASSPSAGATPTASSAATAPSSSTSQQRGEEVGGDNDSISGEINPVVLDASSVRLFIALFDYDPATMSPNVDSIDEELPFREGQILKVFGDKDPDGFYKGESQGRVGFIPCNMVSEVQIDDPELVEQLLKETAETPAAGHSVASIPPVVPADALGDGQLALSDGQLTPNGVVSVPREGPMRKMIAMYDYDPQELSPNVDAELELSFKTGDTVLIYGDMDEDGFFTGEVNGQHGLVPSNFLQPAPLSDDEGLESASVVSAPRSSFRK